MPIISFFCMMLTPLVALERARLPVPQLRHDEASTARIRVVLKLYKEFVRIDSGVGLQLSDALRLCVKPQTQRKGDSVSFTRWG